MNKISIPALVAVLFTSMPLAGSAAETEGAVPGQEATEKDVPVSPAQVEVETEIKGKHFMTMDKDGDGYLSMEEASESLKASWDQFDVNGDGKIDSMEFKKYLQQFAPSELMQEGADPMTGGEMRKDMPVSPMQEEVEKEVR